MIEMLHVGTTWAPVILCDACGEPIRAQAGSTASVVSSGGVAIFRMDGQGLVRYAHKGPCHDRVERALGGFCGWEELTLHLIFLCSNAGLPVRELARVDKDFDASAVCQGPPVPPGARRRIQ